MLDIRVKESPQAITAYLDGEADLKTSGQILKHLGDLLECNPQPLIVVLDNLTFIDSRGLGALVAIYHRAVEQASRFILVTSDAQMQRVMQITGLNKVMPIFTTREEALASFEA